ncbi:MAG: hypothetical protein IT337_01010 [Thermomicrobiales bacterium]|nr:hypothetical protein [Thermomicrobiales bacterium]
MGRDDDETFFYWLLDQGLVAGDIVDPRRMNDRQRCFALKTGAWSLGELPPEARSRFAAAGRRAAAQLG